MLLCLSASHKSAPFTLLEQLSSRSESVTAHIVDHIRSNDIAGAVVIATCNRFEAYIDVRDDGAASTHLLTTAVSAASGISQAELSQAWSIHEGNAAAEHLFSVASGLESVVVGEGEIAGQVRRALQTARAAGTTTSALERLFQRASHTSRGVKNTTPIGRAGRSIVRLALDLAESRVVDWSEVRVLLVGTGAYAGASLAALRDRGATDFRVYSPSGRAERFAVGHGIHAVPEAEYAREAALATVIVTCTTASGHVLDAATLNQGRLDAVHDLPPFAHDETPGCPVNHSASQLVIDLGLPRNVDPDVATVHGVELLDLETVRIHAPLEELQATDTARAIVRQAAHSFGTAADEEALAPAIVALRRRAEQVLNDEIARVAPRDPDGTAERALRHMMGRLMHQPTVRAREMARSGEHERYVDALEALFGIQIDLAVADADPGVAGFEIADEAAS